MSDESAENVPITHIMSTTRFFLVDALTGENRLIQRIVTRYAERSDHGAAAFRVLDHNLYSRRQTRALFISVSLTAAWAVSREMGRPSKEAGFQSEKSETKRKTL